MHRDKQVPPRRSGKTEPDIRRLSRALLALAMAQARAEKEAEEQAKQQPPRDDAPDEVEPGRPA